MQLVAIVEPCCVTLCTFTFINFTCVKELIGKHTVTSD